MTYTIKMPGKFRDWMSGTGLGQGQPDADAGSQSLHRAWQQVKWTRAGRGTTGTIVLDDLAAVAVLAEYATAGVTQNEDGTGDAGEARASQKVLAQCAEVLA